jgi:hypothetical protein
MRVPCPYCKGTGKFRHERPPAVTDQTWFKIVGQAFRCPLCKGLCYVERPMDHLVIDTGLLYIKNTEQRTLVGCPDPSCLKWIDVTEAFSTQAISVSPTQKTAQVPQRDFETKCPNGHDLKITIEPRMQRG